MDQGGLTYIKMPYPKAKDLHLKISVPICLLVITPGIGNAWVTGKYVDSKEVLPLCIKRSNNVSEIIAQGAFAYRTPPVYLPHMRLSFGRSRPFSLSIVAGDLADHFDFGGLPLSALEIQYGAGNQYVDFSYPNQQLMSRMKFAADPGPVQIENAVNANAGEIRLSGETARYRLNFGAELKQNTNLHIGIGVSKVDVFIRSGTAVKVISSNPPLSSHPDDFSYLNKAFWNAPARDHLEPLLYIRNLASYRSLRVHTI
jgi:hypothetical protein